MPFSNLREYLLNLSRPTKQIIVIASDLLLIFLALLTALISTDNNLLGPDLDLYELLFLILFSTLNVLILSVVGVYRSILRYIDFSIIFVLIGSLFLALILSFPLKESYEFILLQILDISIEIVIPFEGWVITFLCSIFLISISRLFASSYLSDSIGEKRVVIYGAGSAGIQLAGALKVSKEMRPIAFLDKNPNLENTFVGGLKIMNPSKLRKLVNRNKVDEVLIAMPSTSKSTLRSLLKEIEEYAIKVRILPGLAELAQGKVLVSELKAVDVSDLLGRYEIEANQELIDRNIKNKTVLITGAGGSIGSEIARQVGRNKPKNMIILDANEFALYEVKNELESILPNQSLQSVIASVTNKKRIAEICKVFAVDTIYHSAAYKHVPLVEENPFEGVFNNIIGTKNCLEAAIDSEVETFVLISTDKAVRPTNIMGATKRFAEMILQSYSDDNNINDITKMTMVRFGNVLGSSGSAIPLFQRQIEEGGPVTVTDPEVTRYFMSIPEAAELVIQAGAMGEGGDVFVLDMGESVRILDLAKRLITLSGFEVKDEANPNGDIEIIFTGLRPGEKLYEELLIGDNVSLTDHKQILRAEEEFITKEEIEECIDKLGEAEKGNDVLALKEIFKQVIHGYKSEHDIVDVLSLHNLRNQTK